MTSAWWTRRSIIAEATVSSPNTSPQRLNALLEETITLARSRDATLEEQVGGLALERDVAHFVDDHQRNPAEADEPGWRTSGVMGGAEAVDHWAAVAKATRCPATQA